MTAPLIACVHLAPWSLTLLTRAHPGVPVATLSESRRVLHANTEALLAGVTPGMREGAALSRCPELHAEIVTPPTAQSAWAELLEVLYARYSDRVEGRTPGIAYLKLSTPAARELAAALHAPVGLAASVEVAHLAALRSKPGEVREVSGTVGGKAEELFLALTPIEHLHVLGLDAQQTEQLRFLGLRGIADLLKWSPAQRTAFLGQSSGSRLNAFLKGQRTPSVEKYRPGQVIEAKLVFDSPLLEPGEAQAAQSELIPPLWAELRGRTCAYLTVQAGTIGGTLSASRKLKWPLDPAGLRRISELALAETDALSLGLEQLTVQLSGLAQPSRMVGLWAGLAELEVTQAVLERFPEALVKVNWLDPFAYAVDAQYEWVDWLTGTVPPTPMTPPKTPKTKTQQRDQAVNRVLAFFEGSSP